jgi:hypothetical protein
MSLFAAMSAGVHPAVPVFMALMSLIMFRSVTSWFGSR